jgi:hypothetical protein
MNQVTSKDGRRTEQHFLCLYFYIINDINIYLRMRIRLNDVILKHRQR